MVNKQLHLAHRLAALSTALLLALLGGCASAPEQPEPEPVVDEPAPMVQAEPEPEPVAVTTPVVELRQDHPETYTVVKGDTLWDISSKFLKDPWMWPELWQVNPQIENPHLIYPGDVLTIYFIDGRPMMRVDRGGTIIEHEGRMPPAEPGIPREVSGTNYPTLKLKPRVREQSLDEAIPTIPLDAIRSFLTRPRIVREDELEEQPYVVAHTDNRLISGAGYTIYARGIDEQEVAADYMLVRAGEEYVDPDTGDVLGYEAIYLGKAQLQDYGDPSTLFVTESNREILRGDRLMPEGDDRLQFNYYPRGPKERVKGRIIAVVDGVAEIGQYQVVVLNLGRQDDMQPGHVLAAMQDGEVVEDTVEGGDVKLPDVKAGTVMVFRVFDRLSYALVMDATKALHVNDTVTNP